MYIKNLFKLVIMACKLDYLIIKLIAVRVNKYGSMFGLYKCGLNAIEVVLYLLLVCVWIFGLLLYSIGSTGHSVACFLIVIILDAPILIIKKYMHRPCS